MKDGSYTFTQHFGCVEQLMGLYPFRSRLSRQRPGRPQRRRPGGARGDSVLRRRIRLGRSTPGSTGRPACRTPASPSSMTAAMRASPPSTCTGARPTSRSATMSAPASRLAKSAMSATPPDRTSTLRSPTSKPASMSIPSAGCRGTPTPATTVAAVPTRSVASWQASASASRTGPIRRLRRRQPGRTFRKLRPRTPSGIVTAASGEKSARTTKQRASNDRAGNEQAAAGAPTDNGAAAPREGDQSAGDGPAEDRERNRERDKDGDADENADSDDENRRTAPLTASPPVTATTKTRGRRQRRWQRRQPAAS